jgi:MFS family permease
MKDPALHSNRWKLLLLQGGRNFILYYPILVLFYQREGLNYTELFLLQSLTSFVQGAWQIPSGYIADRWGRKPTIIISCACTLLGCLIYGAQSGMLWFALATCLISTGMSFQSGTIEALTYDTLAAEGKVSQFRRALGMQSLLRFGGEAVAGVLGGFVAIYSLRLPFWISAIPMGFLLLVALTLKEPPHPRPDAEPYFRALWRSIKLLMSDVRLRRFYILCALIASLSLSLYWFTQPYQEFVGLPLALFGLSHAVVVFCGGLASRGAPTLETRWNDRTIYLGLIATIALCYAFLGIVSAPWGLIFVVLMRMAWGASFPISTDIVNRLAPGHLRATAISLGNMHVQFLMMTVPLAFGYLADTTSLQTTFLALSIFTIVSTGWAFLRLRTFWQKMSCRPIHPPNHAGAGR